ERVVARAPGRLARWAQRAYRRRALLGSAAAVLAIGTLTVTNVLARQQPGTGQEGVIEHVVGEYEIKRIDGATPRRGEAGFASGRVVARLEPGTYCLTAGAKPTTVEVAFAVAAASTHPTPVSITNRRFTAGPPRDRGRMVLVPGGVCFVGKEGPAQ